MLIFLDLESTGVEHDDKLCSMGIVARDGGEEYVVSALVNEGKKIASTASAVHHITDEMLYSQPQFIESETFLFLKEHNISSSTLVVHNAKFIVEKLTSSGFFWNGDIIDTQRVTKHLIPECEFFTLQYLRYELKLYKTEREGIVAHDALSDSYVIAQLFDYLLEIASFKRMKELSFENVLLERLEFGKYKGRYIEEIAMEDRGYLEWLLHKADGIDEDILYSVSYYLEGTL